jgi:hypothetical protein
MLRIWQRELSLEHYFSLRFRNIVEEVCHNHLSLTQIGQILFCVKELCKFR